MTSQVSDLHRISPPALSFLVPRLLLGPGPSNAHPDVLDALGMSLIGHLDPQFLELMNQQQQLLRYCFQTNNQLTVPVSGTGSAAMEATFANLVEDGEKVLVFVAGYFGMRMVDMAGRYTHPNNVVQVTKPFGSVFTLDEISQAISLHRPKVVGIVHADTSTGALQNLNGVSKVVRDVGGYLIVDAVTSLGGVKLFVDDWELDAVYSGSQKCLNCPPGIAPLTLNERAVEKVLKRATQVKNWYLDLSLVAKYWVFFLIKISIYIGTNSYVPPHGSYFSKLCLACSITCCCG